MSMEQTEQTYYLTAGGWTVHRPHEDDVVEAWDLDVYWAHGWSEEYHHWTCMWVTPAGSWGLEQRNALRERYPFPDTTKGRATCTSSIGWPLAEYREGAYAGAFS